MTDYRVELVDSGREFLVDEDDTVLDAALAEGLDLPFGCQSGGCAACRARVVEGEFEYDFDPPGLSSDEKEAGFALLCQARPTSDLKISFDEHMHHKTVPVRTLPARVQERRQLCHDVMSLTLRLPPREPFPFLPGQYVDILLKDGSRRSFSMAAPPVTSNQIELQLRRIPGGRFTDWVFDEMPNKAMLRLEGPLGSFYLRDGDRPAVMVGGGTGFAPLKAMLEAALPKQPDREFYLYWGVRSARDLYQDDLARDWQQRYPNLRYTPVLSEPRPDDEWTGRTGWVHEAVLEDFDSLDGVELYMSGPPVMVEAGKQAFPARGLSLDDLYYDAFEYAFATWPGRD